MDYKDNLSSISPNSTIETVGGITDVNAGGVAMNTSDS